MRKTIFFALLGFNVSAQVFYPDTTFVTEPVMKRYGSPGVLIRQLPDNRLLLRSAGELINNEIKNEDIFILNNDGEVVKQLKDGVFPTFDLNEWNAVITSDNHLMLTRSIGNGAYSIAKLSSDGIMDSTFNFKSSGEFIQKIFLLHNDNFITVASDVNQNRMFDKDGAFLSAIDVSRFTDMKDARLIDMVYNSRNEYFLILADASSNKEIIRLNQELEFDSDFQPIKFDASESYSARLLKDEEGFMAYISDYGAYKNRVLRYRRDGERQWEATFGKISTSITNVRSLYRQDNGALNVVFSDGKHIRVAADGQVDSTFYDRTKHRNTDFLFAFPDGSFWIMQDKSGNIERMNANGEVDKDFRIELQSEMDFYPNQLLRLADTQMYLVGFYRYPYYNTPEFIRYSPLPNVVRIYDANHKPVFEFFDNKTVWETINTPTAFVIRGDGKLYSIDTQNRLTVEKDTLAPGDVVDWQNGYVYRKIKNDSIIRFKAGRGLDTNFVIKDHRLGYFRIMDDGRIAVLNSRIFSDYWVELYFNMYNTDGTRDTTFRTIMLDDKFFRFYTAVPMTIVSVNGYLINQMAVGESANIAQQRFLKYDKHGNFQENYQVNKFRGGGFVRYQKDGSFFMNTAFEFRDDDTTIRHNFVKIDSSGRIDTTFTLLGANAVYGFEFFDENTLYAIADNRIRRFVRRPLEKDEYFYMASMPAKIPWNEADKVVLNFDTNIRNLKVKISGAGVYENETLQLKPQIGEVTIEISDDRGRLLARHTIELTRVTPTFTHNAAEYYNTYAPFEFSVTSSSGLPVDIFINGKTYLNSLIIDPAKDKRLYIDLQCDGDELYEPLKAQMYLEKATPLATEQELVGVKFYPNPVTDLLIVEKNGVTVSTITLIDMNGWEVRPTTAEFADRYELSVTGLPHGLYLLVINSKEKQWTRRIWKE